MVDDTHMSQDTTEMWWLQEVQVSYDRLKCDTALAHMCEACQSGVCVLYTLEAHFGGSQGDLVEHPTSDLLFL